jgi:hypothetical protein
MLRDQGSTRRPKKTKIGPGARSLESKLELEIHHNHDTRLKREITDTGRTSGGRAGTLDGGTLT